jgi:arsenical pump membrane protein
VLVVGLLLIAVAGLLIERIPGPRWLVPVGAAAIAVVARAADRHAIDAASTQLRNPLLFLLAAVPLAELLGKLDLFRSLAALVDGGRHLALALWILGALVTALLNLDTSVVLLTPLAVELARSRSMEEQSLAFGPVLLASLASSPLPVSNLTNLIGAERWDLSASQFAAHLGLPTLIGVVVAWPLLARVFRSRESVVDTSHPDLRALRIGIPIICALTVGFTLGDSLGIPAWAVALAADVILMGVLRHVPWRTPPLGTAAMVLAIGVLSVAATPHLPVDHLLRGSGSLAQLKVVLISAVLAALINNLPAALIVFASVSPSLRWATILGVNVGPLLTLHGSLAGLLWQQSLGRLGVQVSPRRYQEVAWRVGIPAAAAAALTLAFVTG